MREDIISLKEKLDNIEKNEWNKHKNILNWEAEEIIDKEIIYFKIKY